MKRTMLKDGFGTFAKPQAAVVGVVVGLLMAWGGVKDLAAMEASVGATTRSHVSFPTVNSEHKHTQALLENAMRYLDPAQGIVDPVSGYPVEGWNNEPEKAFFLRSFTQLTAIGQWIEVLANVMAGNANTPHLSRQQAELQLRRIVKSLHEDQQDPHLAWRGLLGNFIALECCKRKGPLGCDVQKRAFWEAFGQDKGEVVWQSLKAKRWIVARNGDTQASVQRCGNYGLNGFADELAPYGDPATKEKIMAILDHRVVMVVFGDNANLSTSVAKTIGALLTPPLHDNAGLEDVRRDLEQFLDDQREGYAGLYDPKAGLFHFGRDATANRLIGWEDGEGKWQTGYMDYLVNEFRGPTTFLVVRYGLPVESMRNLGFKIKPYRMPCGKDLYTLAPWEGSAFQALGLDLAMLELKSPGWRTLLENVVDAEIDYSLRHRLPGFLSECYTGEGAQYTGSVGIPEIAVNPTARITNAASLYTLGVAYSVAPAKVERFLAANWPVLSRLLTDHGPWEGFNLARQEPIQCQTTAHTLALILGLMGTGSDNMKRYLDSRGLTPQLAELDKPGPKVNLLADNTTKVFAWSNDKTQLSTQRQAGRFQVKSKGTRDVGIAFVADTAQGVSLSNGRLQLRYRSTESSTPAVLAFKTMGTPHGAWIPKELSTRLVATNGQEEEIEVPLPSTPGLTQIKEVVLTLERSPQPRPIDLSITRLEFTPYDQ
jgi:hypothetical protein